MANFNRMRNNSNWQISEMKDRGLDFLRFLSTEQIVIYGQEKEKIKNIYNTAYSSYRKQLNPKESPIPFPMIVKTLFNSGKLHLRENQFFQGEVPPAYYNSHQSRRHHQQSGNDQNVHNDHKASGSTQKSNGKKNTQFEKSMDDKQQMKVGEKKKRSRNRRYKRKPFGRVTIDQHLLFNINKELTSESDKDSLGSETSQDNNYDVNTFRVSDSEIYTRKVGNIYECTSCLAKCTSRQEMDRHLEGKRHRLSVMTCELKKRRFL
jgi:hypothetical protein